MKAFIEAKCTEIAANFERLKALSGAVVAAADLCTAALRAVISVCSAVRTDAESSFEAFAFSVMTCTPIESLVVLGSSIAVLNTIARLLVERSRTSQSSVRYSTCTSGSLAEYAFASFLRFVLVA